MSTGFTIRSIMTFHGQFLSVLNRIPKIIILLITVFSFSATTLLQAELTYMPVDEVKAGMRGYGKTVFEGTKITRFPLKVRGVLPGAGLSGDSLILVELTGSEVEKHGGISLGMSGSPIYVNNKLIGALSLTFPMTDHSLGGVTPIESMIKTMEYDVSDAGGVTLLKEPLRIGGRTYNRIRIGGGVPKEMEEPDVLVARPALAPVAIRGLSPRTYKIMKRFFDESGIEIRLLQGLSTGNPRQDKNIGPGADIQPGSSVAVQLVRGDIDVSAVGTVTAVDGKRVLLFGHPFFRKGSVEYLLADAHVIAIVQGEDMPFKVTNTGLLRGKVVQDRGSALVGQLDSYPKLIPIDISTIDLDIGRERQTSVKVVQDEDILPNLIVMVVLEALDNTIDKIGEGTSKVRFTLKASGYDKVLERENMFYDRYDISSRSLTELVDALLLLNENRFFESPISSLKINVEIDSSHSVASIEKARIVDQQPSISAGESLETSPSPAPVEEPVTEIQDEEDFEFGIDFQNNIEEFKSQEETDTSPVVYPGDKLTLGIRLRPYREESFEEQLYLKVPQDMTPGKAVINIFSGTRDLRMMMPGSFFIDIKVEGPEEREPQEEELFEEEDLEESFDELVEEFLESDLNNELVATIDNFGFNPLDVSSEDDESKEHESRSSDGKAKKRTDWVLNGSTSINVRVADRNVEEFKARKIKKSTISSLRKED